VVAHYVLLPGLDAFTEGTLSERFQDTDTTGRDSLVESDLRIWAAHPVLGVGPGQAKDYRALHGVAAHTEFTRLLAEHGSAGLGALLLLVVAAVQNTRRPDGPRERGLVAALLGWSFLYMVNSAMRLVAPSFVFGLSFARVANQPVQSDGDRARPVVRRSRSIFVRASPRRVRLVAR